MAPGVIGILALIVAVIAAVKILVLLIKPKAWLDSVVKPIYSIPALTIIVSLVLAGFVLNYLLNAGFTIVDIFAVMAFFSLLMAISFAAYAKDTIVWAGKLLKDKRVIKKAWLAILIWVVLIVWVLYSLFV